MADEGASGAGNASDRGCCRKTCGAKCRREQEDPPACKEQVWGMLGHSSRKAQFSFLVGISFAPGPCSPTWRTVKNVHIYLQYRAAECGAHHPRRGNLIAAVQADPGLRRRAERLAGGLADETSDAPTLYN